MGVTLILKHVDNNDCFISFEKPQKQFQEKLEHIFNQCKKKDDYVCVTFEQPYKPRTTGDKSQNNLFWLIATKISNETGMTLKEVESSLKEKAIPKGYPYHIDKITGRPKGDSMKTINTVQMSYLIDTAYEVCSFMGIVLEPQYAKGGELYKQATGEELVAKAQSVSQLANKSLYALEKENPDNMEFY